MRLCEARPRDNDTPRCHVAQRMAGIMRTSRCPITLSVMPRPGAPEVPIGDSPDRRLRAARLRHLIERYGTLPS
jgi:hypothetical protein